MQSRLVILTIIVLSLLVSAFLMVPDRYMQAGSPSHTSSLAAYPYPYPYPYPGPVYLPIIAKDAFLTP